MDRQQTTRAHATTRWELVWTMVLLLGSCGGVRAGASGKLGNHRPAHETATQANLSTECGGDLCAQEVDVCVQRETDEATVAACEAVPDECQDDRTCACLATSICDGGIDDCRDIGSNVILCLTPPGPVVTEETPCGDGACIAAQQVCVGTVADDMIDFACVELPPDCVEDRSCACLGTSLCQAPRTYCTDAGEDNVVICSVPDVGGPDLTPCGDDDLVCETATQVCIERILPDGTSTASCEAVPDDCADDRTCDCLAPLCTGALNVCSDLDENVVQCSS